MNPLLLVLPSDETPAARTQGFFATFLTPPIILLHIPSNSRMHELPPHPAPVGRYDSGLSPPPCCTSRSSTGRRRNGTVPSTNLLFVVVSPVVDVHSLCSLLCACVSLLDGIRLHTQAWRISSESRTLVVVSRCPVCGCLRMKITTTTTLVSRACRCFTSPEEQQRDATQCNAAQRVEAPVPPS